MGTKTAENIDRAITLHFVKEFIFEVKRVGMDQIMDVYRKIPEKDRKLNKKQQSIAEATEIEFVCIDASFCDADELLQTILKRK